MKAVVVLLLLGVVGAGGYVLWDRLGPSENQMSDPERIAKIDQLYFEFEAAFPKVPEYTVSDFKKLKEDSKDWVLVDVRYPAEQDVSMIPGAIREKDFNEMLKRDDGSLKRKKIIGYCTIGYRSGVFASKLRSEGFEAYSLKGSILSWTHAGEKLHDRQGRETKRVHVYGKDWDLAAIGYTSVW